MNSFHVLKFQVQRVSPNPDDAQKFRRSKVAHFSDPQSVWAMAMYALSAVTDFWFNMVHNAGFLHIRKHSESHRISDVRLCVPCRLSVELRRLHY